MPNGTVHSGGREATTGNTSAVRRLPHVWLLFLLVGYKRAVLGTTILSNGKGHFGPPDRDNRSGQNGRPSKLVPNIPVGPNRNGPFHLMYQPKFLNAGLNGKRPWALTFSERAHGKKSQKRNVGRGKAER